MTMILTTKRYKTCYKKKREGFSTWPRLFSLPRSGVKGCRHYKIMDLTTLQPFTDTHITPFLSQLGCKNISAHQQYFPSVMVKRERRISHGEYPRNIGAQGSDLLGIRTSIVGLSAHVPQMPCLSRTQKEQVRVRTPCACPDKTTLLSKTARSWDSVTWKALSSCCEPCARTCSQRRKWSGAPIINTVLL